MFSLLQSLARIQFLRPARLGLVLISLGLSCGLTWVPSLHDTPTGSFGNDIDTLGVAWTLRHQGVFADPQDALMPRPAPGAQASPLYPAFLAGLMSLDETFDRQTECLLRQTSIVTPALPPTCSQTLSASTASLTAPFGIATVAQHGLVALTLLLVALAAQTLIGGQTPLSRAGIGWVSMGLAVAFGPYSFQAHHFQTTSLLVLMGTALSLCLARAAHPDRRHGLNRRATQASIYHRLFWFAASGGIGGLCTLTQTAFGSILCGVIAFTVIIGLFRPAQRRILWGGALLMTLALGLTVLPWLMRNLHLLGLWTLTTQSPNSFATYLAARLSLSSAVSATSPTSWSTAWSGLSVDQIFTLCSEILLTGMLLFCWRTKRWDWWAFCGPALLALILQRTAVTLLIPAMDLLLPSLTLTVTGTLVAWRRKAPTSVRAEHAPYRA